jgi:hypothetical protein
MPSKRNPGVLRSNHRLLNDRFRCVSAIAACFLLNLCPADNSLSLDQSVQERRTVASGKNRVSGESGKAMNP